MKNYASQFLIALALVIIGSLLAHFVQTGAGSVAVTEVRFAGAQGNMMSGLLYVPADATSADPAPGVLAIHGYINSRETQSGFAIEFARRGYVVLALDQTGHGYSDPPAFAHGFGGPDGLAYLRSLPYVDGKKIGLEGHSMGGWAVQMAAAGAPRDYQSMILAGSSTGTFGAPVGTPDQPTNLLVIFSLFDEFSDFMWGAQVPSDIVDTEKLKTVFGSETSVQVGTLYGDLEKGTARKLLMPAVTHPGDHLSREAIAAAVEWLDLTLGHHSTLESSDQVWFWKEFGTLLALIGVVLMIFPMIQMLIFLFPSRETVVEIDEAVDQSRTIFGFNVMATMLIPVLTFFPLQTIADVLLPATAYLPQQITNGILLWAWGNGLISLGMFYFWNRKHGKNQVQLGLPLTKAAIFRALVIAVPVCVFIYLVLLVVDLFLIVDFRFWVVALKLMSPTQFGVFFIYLLPFTAYFLVLSLSLHNSLRRNSSHGRSLWTNSVILSGGFVLLLAFQYLPLLLGGTLAIPSMPLLSIVAFQFVPLLFMVGAISTFCYENTGNIYTGAFVNSILVTWYMVAGTATQAVPFWF